MPIRSARPAMPGDPVVTMPERPTEAMREAFEVGRDAGRDFAYCYWLMVAAWQEEQSRLPPERRLGCR